MRWRGRLFLVLLVLLTAINAGRMAVHESYDGPGAGRSDLILVVPPGGTQQVASTLAKAGVIDYKLIFRAAAWFTRGQGPLRTGEYLFPQHASLHQILDILRHGAEVQHQATIPEGLTGSQIADILNALPVATGHVAPPAEGAVLPQTYDYVYDTPRNTILARAEAAMQGKLASLWAGRDPAVPLDSPAQAVILASIVQQETPLESDMPMIAAVYENRLKAGMKLQADPTVIYAATDGKQSGGTGITKADLALDSPYNTYVVQGLPPGPICNPGEAALQAVLHPAQSDALYFIAAKDGTGRSVFSTGLKQQLDNIQHLWNQKN
ncbi:endolytic transglycosylase MltG [Acidocella facilis]|uniref:endolytic transglycosylase MltG n=1 Tax=Acidocella facilis TaxID=525 RepID=UPI000478D034|nr:endolytic transglycosylase MltG [Acidocella facilis]